ncbi:MAG: CHASE2 domain-containing protein, partial [bacterium]|nr:CHASE2 domain-containing protein [bacterium]
YTDVHKRREDIRASLVAKLREPGNLEIFLKPLPSSTTQPAEKAEAQKYFIQAMARTKELFALEAKLLQKNLELDASIKSLTDELRPMVNNKICVLSTTAAGAPDFVPTPLGPRTPGGFVHSHIINTILSDNFVYPAGMLTNTLVIALSGILVSLLAATRPILQASPLSILAAIAYALFNIFIVFAWWGIWLAFVAPLGAMLLSFMFVTGFRQLTEERAKRRIRDMWAKGLSPALVEQILSNPALASPGGRKT